MRRALGSLIFLTLSLWGGFQWEVTLATKEPYRYEPFLVRLECAFDDFAPNTRIELAPEQAGVRFVRKEYIEKLVDEKRHMIFEYVVAIEDATITHLEFHPLIRTTTDQSIENYIIGRDNYRQLAYDDTPVHLRSKPLHVLPLPEGTVVGNFTLTRTLDTVSVEAYAPVALRFRVEGVGDFQSIQAPFVPIEGVEHFAAAPVRETHLTAQGDEGSVVWQYALVGEHNYTLDEAVWRYFDLQSRTFKEITLPSQAVQVTSVDTASLLTQAPQEESALIAWESVTKAVMFYLLGALSMVAWRVGRGYLRPKKGAWEEGFEAPLAFLHALIALEEKRVAPLIEEIERDWREGKLHSIAHYRRRYRALV
ncbi:MAG: hypothetical protein KU37_07310 [Sulfuricurvum sp. PC08-66]|nr:MAG: hypothetical protein KU37_07310 [Sulfuricurvum sp. PC08-66]